MSNAYFSTLRTVNGDAFAVFITARDGVARARSIPSGVDADGWNPELASVYLGEIPIPQAQRTARALRERLIAEVG